MWRKWPLAAAYWECGCEGSRISPWRTGSLLSDRKREWLNSICPSALTCISFLASLSIATVASTVWRRTDSQVGESKWRVK